MRAPVLLVTVAVLLASGCLGGDSEGPAPAETGEDASGMNDGTAAGNATGSGNATTPSPGMARTAPPPVSIAVRTSGIYPVNPVFDPAALEAPAGALVTLTFANEDPAAALVQHNWVLDGVAGAETDAIAQGESASVEFTAPAPGEYAFYCSVGDHRGRGMEGVLTVS
ncbi:MAG: cupredoxin domain-containing protein [Methanobacteriota archaeon]